MITNATWKKSIAIALGTAMAAFVTAGCNSVASTVGLENRGQTITAEAWNIIGDLYVEAGDRFTKNHPDIKVDVLYSESNYPRIIPRMQAGIDLSDIIFIQNKDIPAMLEKYPDSFMDLTDYAAPLKDKFVDSAWTAVTKDGKIYGIPADIGPVGLFYRADIFEKAGVKASEIETWDDFIEADKKIKVATNGECSIIGMSEDGDFFEMLLNEAGGSYVSEDGKTVVVNSPEGKKALAMVKKLLDSGACRNVKSWDGRLVAMRRNQIASAPYGVWFAGTISSQLPEQAGKWKVMPLPAFEKGGNRASNCGGSVMAVYKGTKHKEAAIAFIDYLLNTEEGELMQIDKGIFPAYKPIYEAKVFKETVPYFGEPIYPFFAEIGNQIPVFHRGPIMLDAGKVFGDLVPKVLEGQNTDKILDDAAKDIASLTGLKAGE